MHSVSFEGGRMETIFTIGHWHCLGGKSPYAPGARPACTVPVVNGSFFFFSVTVKVDGIFFFTWLSMLSQIQARATCRSSYMRNSMLSGTFPFSLYIYVKHSLGAHASHGFALWAVAPVGELDFHVNSHFWYFVLYNGHCVRCKSGLLCRWLPLYCLSLLTCNDVQSSMKHQHQTWYQDNVAHPLDCHVLPVEYMFARKVASSEQVGLGKMLQVPFEAI